MLKLLFTAVGLVALASNARGAEARPVPELPSTLLFERNGGAFDDDVAFVARGGGMTLFACGDGVVLRLAGDDGRPAAAVRTTFVGAAADPSISGVEPHRARVHHLRGRDREDWSVDNRTFTRVRYDEVWPGIDLVLYDAGGALEYDFVVAPGVDPGVIALAYDGVEAITVAPCGELVLATAAGELRQSAPLVYQEGASGREVVESRFVPAADGSVRFGLGPYDASRALVIDPVLSYATYVGGANIDYVTDVAVDAIGRAVVCGYTKSSDLPSTAGVLQDSHSAAPNTDAFVACLSADGTEFEWLTYLGGADPTWPHGSPASHAYAVDVDGAGNVVVGGKTHCDDFPLLNAFDAVCEYEDAFLAKLTADGSSLVYSTLIGGPRSGGGGDDAVRSIHCGDDGTTWVAGESHSPTGAIPVTAGAFDELSQSSGSDGYVMKLDPAGAVLWCTYLGGHLGQGQAPTSGPAPRNRLWDLDVDGSGRVYVAGYTNTSDFPVPGGFDTSGCDGVDLGEFWAGRLSADGSSLDYGTFIGGSHVESESHPVGIACADDGRLWFVGSTTSSDYPVTAGAYDTVFNGSTSSQDAVVTCIDTDQTGASSVLFSTFLGAGGQDFLLDVEVDGAGNAYTVGITAGSGFPMIGAWQTANAGSQDVVMVVLDSTGQPVESTFFGGAGAESAVAASLALGPGGDVYVGFATSSVGLATPGAAQPLHGGAVADGMIVRWRTGAPVCQADLGFDGPGDAVLSLCGGDLSSGVFSRLRIDGLFAFQPAWLLVGQGSVPTYVFAVGAQLVPSPLLIAVPVATDSGGDLELLIGGGAGPVSLVMQAIVAQAGTPKGWSVTNAIQADFFP